MEYINGLLWENKNIYFDNKCNKNISCLGIDMLRKGQDTVK